MILGIDHVNITIPVGEESLARAFYCGLLGLDELEKPENLKINGGLWLQAGSITVHIGCENNPHRADTKSHIAYNVDNIQSYRDKLTAHGVQISENTPIAGYMRFDIRDPFGNRIELMEKC